MPDLRADKYEVGAKVLDDRHPPHFCRAQVTGRWDASLKGFPELPREMEGAAVELGPGDALYLPAGWFHEVTSRGEGGGAHLAVNWWFYPPDRLDGDGKEPYATSPL